MTFCRKTLEQTIRAAVTIVWSDQDIAGPQQMTNERERRHAGRGDHGAGAAFELGQGIRQRVSRGVAGTGVVVFAFLSVSRKREIG